MAGCSSWVAPMQLYAAQFSGAAVDVDTGEAPAAQKAPSPPAQRGEAGTGV